MIKIEQKEYLMGNNFDDGMATDFESPPKKVKVKEFWIDETTVTNQMFKEFVDKTNYITEAEKAGYSFVFHLLLEPEVLEKSEKVISTPWWYIVDGACWKKPYGSNSTIEKILDHPVVHVTRNDAVEYCKWANKRLPTEAEWELAARGGEYIEKFPWGKEKIIDGKWMLNIFQGTFPNKNTAEDGFLGTSPCKVFAPNNFGIYQMLGNVWEWCSNPKGVAFEEFNKISTQEYWNKCLDYSTKLVAIRGGSYLCCDDFCTRYKSYSRNGNLANSFSSNLGFRCVSDKEI